MVSSSEDLVSILTYAHQTASIVTETASDRIQPAEDQSRETMPVHDGKCDYQATAGHLLNVYHVDDDCPAYSNPRLAPSLWDIADWLC